MVGEGLFSFDVRFVFRVLKQDVCQVGEMFAQYRAEKLELDLHVVAYTLLVASSDDKFESFVPRLDII